MIYTINKAFLPMVREHVLKFSNKFDKYGYGDITFNVSNERRCDDKSSSKYNQILVDVEIEASYKINDYEFVASLEYHDDIGCNIVKKLSDDVYMPEEYRTTTKCDHCGVDRYRKYTVVLRNTVTDEYVQVGKSCVKDYLGVNAENYVSYLSIFDNMDQYIDSISTDKSLRPIIAYSVSDILRQTYEYVNRFGYQSKASAYENGCDPTSSRVFMAMNHVTDMHGRVIYDEYALSDESADYEKSVRDFFEAVEDSSDYIFNLKNILRSECVESKDFGLVVSAVGTYIRMIKKVEEEKKNASNPSNYVGNVGDKITFTAKPVCVYSAEGMYGMSYIYKFDVNGDVIVWRTGKSLGDVEITLKGTVKSQSTYRGVKQTEVTRCKVA